MDKLLKYKVNNNIMLCPVSFNNSIIKNQHSMGGNEIKLEEKKLVEILNKVRADLDTMYILDFCDIRKVCMEEKSVDEMSGLNNVIFYFRNDFNIDFIKSNCNELRIIRDEYGFLVLFNNVHQLLLEFVDQKLKDKNDIIKTIHQYVYFNFFVQDIEKNRYKFEMDKLKYLESSNVYVNYYINVKAIFMKPDYMRYMINDLSQLIIKNFQNNKKICLLGVSNNGIILSRILAYKLQLEVKSINHIGPKYCLDSDIEVLRDLEDKRFILVSDVICLGGEYRMAKSILEVLGAKLLGAVCVVKIRDVYRSEKIINKDTVRENRDFIYSIVDNINSCEIDKKNIDYKIYVDREVQV